MKSGINIVKQVELLKNRVFLSHPDFLNFHGMIVSVRVNSNYYWILLDNQYINKNGKHTRLRMFNEKFINVIKE